MVRPDRKESEESYLAAAINVARLRVLYAETWQIERMRANSDLAATQRTIEKTGDQLTIAQAQMNVLAWRLRESESE